MIGLATFAALTWLTATTGSPLAIGLVLVVGSFLVPAVYVEYMDEIDLFSGIARRTLAVVALATALVALPSAIALESVTHAAAGTFIPALLTGLIEEAVKLLIVLWILRSMTFRFELDGIIIGAAAGMGFAAFEDMTFAIGQLVQHGVPELLTNLWLRQVLGPFGHGTWTAAICAVLWSQRFGARGLLGLLNWRVVVAYLVSSTLHGLWDWQPFHGGVLDLGVMLLVGVVSILVVRFHIRTALAQENYTIASSQGANQAAAPAGAR